MEQGCLFDSDDFSPYCGCNSSTHGFPDPAAAFNISGDGAECVAFQDSEEIFMQALLYISATNTAEGLNITIPQVCLLLEEAVANATPPPPPPGDGRRRLLQSSPALPLPPPPPPPGLWPENTSSVAKDPTGTHVLPKIKDFTCAGPFLTGDCKDDSVPFISGDSLHQVRRGRDPGGSGRHVPGVVVPFR